MALLECIGLVKDYPGKRAVDNVDFYVDRAEIVGLLGPNGAGKTTSFRMACGLIAPTKGLVRLGGKDVTDWPMYKRARSGMGYLPQDNSIFRKLHRRAECFGDPGISQREPQGAQASDRSAARPVRPR